MDWRICWSLSLASLSHLANDYPVNYRFFTVWPWGLTPRPKFTKGEMICYPPISFILSNFIALHQSVPEISVTKIICRQTNKQTVNDISPACPLSCRDNKLERTWHWRVSLLCCTVPAVLPEVEVSAGGPTSLTVEWNALSPDQARGIITRHHLIYRQHGGLTQHTVDLAGSVHEHVITGMQMALCFVL